MSLNKFPFSNNLTQLYQKIILDIKGQWNVFFWGMIYSTDLIDDEAYEC